MSMQSLITRAARMILWLDEDPTLPRITMCDPCDGVGRRRSGQTCRDCQGRGFVGEHGWGWMFGAAAALFLSCWALAQLFIVVAS